MIKRLIFAIYSIQSLVLLVHAADYCGNDLSFLFKDSSSETRDCTWVRYAEETVRQDVCQRSDVRSECPYSCGICCETTHLTRWRCPTVVQKVAIGSYQKKMGVDIGATLNGKKRERKSEMSVQYPASIVLQKSN
jgi:hypothetical protein